MHTRLVNDRCKEWTVVGPPGTGKTTYVSRQVERAVTAACDRDGIHPGECTEVLVSSLTRAAATEVAGRGLELPREQVATLHAHAWRALGRPTLCVDPKHIREWNANCQPQFRVPLAATDDDSATTTDHGNPLEDYHYQRSRLVPVKMWSSYLQGFAKEYEAWKRVNGWVDFSDVIHDAYDTATSAPGNPRVIFVDEAQDHDAAELRLIRHWAESAERIVVVGDPDQNLYQWRGADPHAFYGDDVPESQRRVLSQSYRVPRRVHAFARDIITRCSDRIDAPYQPVDREGAVDWWDCAIQRDAAELADRIEQLLDATEGRVMLLATCYYQLKGVLAEFRARGVAYWNPYATNRGNFNPLHGEGVTTRERILAYLRPQRQTWDDEARPWTWADLDSWVGLLNVSWLQRGARKDITRYAAERPHDEVSFTEMLELVRGDADLLSRIDSGDLSFLREHCPESKRGPLSYALSVHSRSIGGLFDAQEPRLIVGTIHSVKGGEAETVILAPDVSPQSIQREDDDQLHRVFYVGATRAQHRLILLEPYGNACYEW